GSTGGESGTSGGGSFGPENGDSARRRRSASVSLGMDSSLLDSVLASGNASAARFGRAGCARAIKARRGRQERLLILGQPLAAALTGLLPGLHGLTVAVRILADLALVAAMALLAAHVVIALAGILRLLSGHGTIVAGAMRRLRIALLFH